MDDPKGLKGPATNTLAVWVDAVYDRTDGPEDARHVARAPDFDIEATGPTRAEASLALIDRLARRFRDAVARDEHESLFRGAGLYPENSTQWVPRVSSGDERLYIHVSPGPGACGS